MKVFKKVVLAILVTLFIGNVSAQTGDTTKKSNSTVISTPAYVPMSSSTPVKSKVISRIGLRSGLNFASAKFANDNFDGNQIQNDGMESAVRGSAMFLWENGKSEYFVTQVGLGYSGKGFKTPLGTLTMHYIELPIIWNFRLPIAGPVYIMGGFGPYFSFAFNGKLKTPELIPGEPTTFNDILEYTPGKSASDNKLFNPFDAGLIFGGSVEIKLPEGKFLEVGAHYQVGVQKISNKWSEEDPNNAGNYIYDNPGVRNSVFSINVSFLFDLNKAKK